jgi:hypothetical protein
MPDRRWARCRECGVHRNEAGELSWTGLCVPCGDRLRAENIMGLHLKTGYPLDRWRRAMAASVGGVLLDDVLPPE